MGRRRLRAFTSTVTALGLVAGTTLTGAAAQAAVRPATCGWINIGLPTRYTISGVYAGEAEQEYDTCTENVLSHFQWSAGYRNNNPYAYVRTYALGWTGVTDVETDQYAYVNQDVYSGGTEIHRSNPDNWQVALLVEDPNGKGCGWGLGDWHIYATGGTSGTPQSPSC
jgi:hypothetical protein